MTCLDITAAMRTVAIEVLLKSSPHCTCRWKLRPELESADSTAVINEIQNLPVSDNLNGLRGCKEIPSYR
jgi:hypothetical protein